MCIQNPVLFFDNISICDFFLTSLICGLDLDPIPATGSADTSPQGPACRMHTEVHACRPSSLRAEAGGFLESRSLRPAKHHSNILYFFKKRKAIIIIIYIDKLLSLKHEGQELGRWLSC